MKFLCVECDSAMKLAETRGPDRGSMTVLFECESCGKQTAMLTNSMETQMVSSLGVSIGGRTAEPEPMEMLHSTLDRNGESADAAAPEPAAREPEPSPAAEPAGESKCPFTGMVNEAMGQAESGELVWTDDAKARMDRIPAFVRPMVRRGIEDHAKSKGLRQIDGDVLEAVRKDIGM